MRRVIGSNRVDSPIANRFNQSNSIFFGAQRRVHLCIGVEARDRSVRQSEMVWGYFAGYSHAALLRAANQFYGSRSRNVSYMNSRAGQLSQHDVSRHVADFGGA